VDLSVPARRDAIDAAHPSRGLEVVPMRFHNGCRTFYCGVDLHARSMFTHVPDHAGPTHGRGPEGWRIASPGRVREAGVMLRKARRADGTVLLRRSSGPEND
jgi:hypothetical protein